ncbi:hypothetical protein ACIQAC_15280 [Streptomyces sp. NPDC088387]|uniref:hypothetical protein n=1 Tax=Streptomyces sp. NPDC088387 TaxID=3365859 RepID=UPI0037F5FA3E
MGRGEESDEPITADDHFAVVVSGDGTAAIDGVPVRVPEGETGDAAILDALQARARALDTPVTATVSDPAAGYVAHVEVAPDGSSRLLEQRDTDEADFDAVEVAEADGEDEGEGKDAPDPDDADTGPEADPLVLEEWDEDDELPAAKPLPADDALDTVDTFDTFDTFDEESYTLPEPPPPPPPASDLAPDPDPDPDHEPEHDDHDADDAYEPALSPPPTPTRTAFPPLVRRLDRGNGGRQSDDEYTPSGLLQRPLIVAPAALAVAGIVIVSLVVLGSGGSGDDTQQQSARAGAPTSGSPSPEATPTYSVSVSAPSSPSASPSPSKSPKPKKTAGSSEPALPAAGGPTVTETAPRSTTTVTADPAVDTAATAVRRLARQDPAGRHICYRAYVSGTGWQKPVCDGTLAGTTGQNKPIKALNIAVHGVNGSAANAVLYNSGSTNGEGRWQPSWSAITGDGKNIYIGKTSAKYMTGFAINVGSGRVCPSAKVSGFDWGSQGCADPRPNFVFGGAMENERRLEAVKITV